MPAVHEGELICTSCESEEFKLWAISFDGEKPRILSIICRTCEKLYQIDADGAVTEGVKFHA